MFKFEIGRKFENSEFDRPGFFRRGEISASLNFDGKVAWAKDMFARCEMKIEKESLSYSASNLLVLGFMIQPGTLHKKSDMHMRYLLNTDRLYRMLTIRIDIDSIPVYLILCLQPL